MTIEEFGARTGCHPTPDYYHDKIEQLYYNFDGNEDEFCAYWGEGFRYACRDMFGKLFENSFYLAEYLANGDIAEVDANEIIA